VPVKPTSSERATGSSRNRPASAPEALTLSTFLPYRLNVVATVASEGLARIYGERFGIGIPEWRVLATVGEFRSVTATTIGRHAHMSKVKVSRAVSSLEARNFIQRQSNERDLREAFLVLTSQGQTLYGQIAPLALGYVEALTACLSGEERAALDRVLDKLLQRAGDMKLIVGEGDPGSDLLR
jgi:DNA-binding MarR family transcriptional regulator